MGVFVWSPLLTSPRFCWVGKGWLIMIGCGIQQRGGWASESLNFSLKLEICTCTRTNSCRCCYEGHGNVCAEPRVS